MDISFLIPALNEAANIGNCIASIQEYAPRPCTIEIIVGDHGSQDATAAIAQGMGASVIAHRKSTVGELRNSLADRSSGRILIFLDADVTLTPQWQAAIQPVLAELETQPLQITGSRCDPPQSEAYLLKYWFNKMNKDAANYVGTGHMILTRILFDSLRGFDSTLISGEDFDICARAKSAGAAVKLNPLLRTIHHDYPLTVSQFVRRERWHGTGDVQSLDKFLKSRVAQMAAAFMALHLLIVVSVFINRAIAIAGIVLLVLLLSVSSFAKFKRLSFLERLSNIAIFYVYFLGRSASVFRAVGNLF
jgi:glycosyltransferase involved in cell wall biosynthesis